MPTRHIIITGKVQGVFFRATAKKVAREFGLLGWVKNTENEVEIVANGDEINLGQFLNWCKAGPPQAEVTDVIVTIIPEERFTAFRILH